MMIDRDEVPAIRSFHLNLLLRTLSQFGVGAGLMSNSSQNSGSSWFQRREIISIEKVYKILIYSIENYEKILQNWNFKIEMQNAHFSDHAWLSTAYIEFVYSPQSVKMSPICTNGPKPSPKFRKHPAACPVAGAEAMVAVRGLAGWVRI
jgi:hypothetical protein